MSNEEQVLEHTPGEWRYKAVTIGHPDNPMNPIVDAPGHYICRLFSDASTLRGLTSRAPEHSSALGNASLIALAPTAPHRCNVPDCPGPKNQARLDAAAALAMTASGILGHIRELADAWRSGALNETDGQGATRSNRNIDLYIELHAALAAYHAAQTEASPEVNDDN